MLIFISYSSKDKKLKDELRKALSPLQSVGTYVWSDHLLEPGVPWEEKIEQAIKDADVVMMLISTDSLSSEYCIREVQAAGPKLLPILARPTHFKSYPWLAKREVWPPKDAQGRRRALSEMDKPERDAFYAVLTNFITTERTDSVPHSDKLSSEEMCERFARTEARVYDSGNRDGALQNLLRACIKLSDQRNDVFATLTARAFRSALAMDDNAIFPSHRDILDLLQAGLPVNPVHLKDLSSLDLDSLLRNPGYAAVLRGIRLTETDYESAERELEKVAENWSILSHCPLRIYAIGQARRKREQLKPARSILEQGLRQINPTTRECQLCGVHCKNAPLSVEIHRGLGTVARRLSDRTEETGDVQGAERYSQEALGHFEHAEKSFNEDVSDNVKSDVFYSHAYFLFERTYKEYGANPERATSTQYLQGLSSSKELFKESAGLRPHWAAPRARLQIVKQLLGDFDVDGYLDARDVAKTERGPESHLTAHICGFAVLMGGAEDSGLTPRGICGELRDILQRTFVAKGPLACHAFDNTAIIDGRPVTDVWLRVANDLLQFAAKWKSKTLGDQRVLLQQTLISLNAE